MPDTLAQNDRLEKTRAYICEQDAEIAISSAKLSHIILDQILAFLQPGIKESEVREFALRLFETHQIERTWHPPHVRFSEHTLLTFRDKAQEDLTLGEEDIVFVDIGIVKNAIEGDAGRTILFGNNPVYHQLQLASEQIFDEARHYWKQQNPSGIDLYNRIHHIAKNLNVEFNLDPAGHLIGAFPHRGWKRGINNFPESVEAGKWILEIQIRHMELPYGAFFENLLY